MFRVMLYDDLREVLRIELDSFAHPWSEQDFLEHLANPQSVAIVAERDDRIVGYVVFGIGKLKPWVQLYSCVVCRNFRRRGLGSEMVTCLMRGATARKLGESPSKFRSETWTHNSSSDNWGFVHSKPFPPIFRTAKMHTSWRTPGQAGKSRASTLNLSRTS